MKEGNTRQLRAKASQSILLQDLAAKVVRSRQSIFSEWGYFLNAMEGLAVRIQSKIFHYEYSNYPRNL